jgi:hypothetical protein
MVERHVEGNNITRYEGEKKELAEGEKIKCVEGEKIEIVEGEDFFLLLFSLGYVFILLPPVLFTRNSLLFRYIK